MAKPSHRTAALKKHWNDLNREIESSAKLKHASHEVVHAASLKALKAIEVRHVAAGNKDAVISATA